MSVTSKLFGNSQEALRRIVFGLSLVVLFSSFPTIAGLGDQGTATQGLPRLDTPSADPATALERTEDFLRQFLGDGPTVPAELTGEVDDEALSAEVDAADGPEYAEPTIGAEAADDPIADRAAALVGMAREGRRLLQQAYEDHAARDIAVAGAERSRADSTVTDRPVSTDRMTSLEALLSRLEIATSATVASWTARDEPVSPSQPPPITLPPIASSDAERSVLRERPMAHPDAPELYQRVLTLPGARLYAQPWTEPPSSEELPAFSIFYVYHEVEQSGQRWVEVGADAFGVTDGWLPAEMVEEWHSMLVMQFAPRGQRERVLFFRDKVDLIDLVRSPWGAELVLDTFEEIREARHDAEIFVAIEPAAAVARDQLYLMPILQSQHDTFYNGAETTLLEVAGLNLSETEPQVSLDQADQLGRVQPGLRDFKIGVAFVIDTTISMGPYIQETYQTVARILAAFDQADEMDSVGFGLVGYRDDVSFNPTIDYVTRVYQPLDATASRTDLLDNLGRVRASSVPTADWDEDAFAGLKAAIEELDWDPFDLRLIVLITDAGPRLGTHPRAMHPELDALNVVEMANRKNIAIVPVHLLTPEAARFDNLDYAAEQYRRLARTGDFAASKYFGVDTGSPEAFAAQIGVFADDLVDSLVQARRGRVVQPRQLEDAAAVEPRTLGDILVNEIFRAQLEYLGRERGVEAPRFYRAWAADQDLVEPRRSAMTVNVFLARNQLSSLAQSLDNIIGAAGATAASPQAFFEELQVLAAATAVEGGGRFSGAASDEVTGADLLPAFLRILPYRSKALTLDRQTWLDFGQTGQTEFLDELRAKRRAYREIYEDTDNWIDLGAGDPALEVYPMSLSLLP